MKIALQREQIPNWDSLSGPFSKNGKLNFYFWAELGPWQHCRVGLLPDKRGGAPEGRELTKLSLWKN